MASQPGPLTRWPWHRLGNFKYVLLAPWVAHSMHKFMADSGEQLRDMSNFLIFPMLLLRLLHSQLWITFSRFQTAKSKHRIVDKSLDFDQVDRERNWDDQIILTALFLYMVNMVVPGGSHLPWWETRGVVLIILLHMGPVEFIYYWLHRALHHHFLYLRYHSHHHASIVTEPITSVIHPFAEELSYFVLFAFPLVTAALTGTLSIAAVVGYPMYVDFMNYMGHCNFELVPKWLFDVFPPLKYLMYTPSFHSLHHTQFRTNYSLFMPFYDYVYGTIDKSSDEQYERSLKGKEERPHVVHLTHLTNLQSIYHLRFGFSSLASKPYTPKYYMWIMWPLTLASMLLTWIYGTAFTAERNRFKKLIMETRVVPRYIFQYKSSSERDAINTLIEKAILQSEEEGAKVISLGLLNQGSALNGYGELYLKRNSLLKTKIVDGTSLAVAGVLNSVPKGTNSILLVGNLSKMAYFLSLTLCKRGVQVEMVQKDKYELLKLQLPPELHGHLVLSDSYASEVWLVGDGVTDQEQLRASKGIRFIPFTQFPPKLVRKDCIYHCTPAMVVPRTYENLHTCENWLPRSVMSAWRVAGIVHALEEWNGHECGDTVTGVEKAWHAALAHGFLPFQGCKLG
ncbi:very-long-chain aldehyde decarbonylase GL1-6-like isoform X1 [Phoenix dactylifera]|uniref:aldehyde oxygenase (deformylating) n=2 Tax=Phoenix dactylifera TaxID=42345 RepID=A0A8B8ZA23_PHODC|nr:very-long-chain aldehyde decarbonylase GL1-6-like isoform X1 [Phoenix dactylifera]